MIAAASPHPADTALARLFDRQFRGAFHDQMAQSVVAVHESRSGLAAHDPYVRPGIDGAALNLLHVLRQTKHAVRIPSARVRFCHQSGHLTGVFRGNPRSRQRTRNKFNKCCDLNERMTRRSFCSFAHGSAPLTPGKSRVAFARIILRSCSYAELSPPRETKM